MAGSSWNWELEGQVRVLVGTTGPTNVTAFSASFTHGQ